MPKDRVAILRAVIASFVIGGLILLFAIYRSVILPFIPIFVVAMAYTVAQAFVYLYAEAGQSVATRVVSTLPPVASLSMKNPATTAAVTSPL